MYFFVYLSCAGVPARVVKQNNQRVCEDLDQIHIPDPVSMEFCKLSMRMDELAKQLDALKGDKKNENI